MKLRFINYDLRKVRDFIATVSIVSLSFAGIMGCSDSGTDTAGVLSETESGQTANVNEFGEKVVNVNSCSAGIPNSLRKQVLRSNDFETHCITYQREYTLTDIKGTAVDNSGNPIKNARVYLKRVDGNYDVDEGLSHEILDRETVTDEQGNYSFKDLVYKASYLGMVPIDVTTEPDGMGNMVAYYDYTLQVESENQSLASYGILSIKDAELMTQGDITFREVETPVLQETFSTEIKLNRSNFKAGEKVCLGLSFTCHILSEDEVTKGSFLMENIPNGVYTDLCRYNSYAQGTTSEYTVANCKSLDELIITREAVGFVNFVMSEKAAALLDSLTDKTLKNVVVNLSLENYPDAAMMVSGTNVSLLTQPNGSQGNPPYWAEINLTSSDTVYGKLLKGPATVNQSRILFAESNIQDTTLAKGIGTPEKTNIGYSFKINLDGTQEESEVVLLSNVEDQGNPMGIEIRQCEAGSQSLCTRIYSGLDSVATDTTLYGKADILDGKEHQFTLVMVSNHLTIAVDGDVIRDTDLKLSTEFPYNHSENNRLVIGKAKLKDFVTFRMDEDIRHKGEVNWNRLKAWIITHQTFSK